MTLVSDLKNIDGYFTITMLVLFLSVLAPGVLTIYLFLPDLFIKLDGFKFVLFSASLALPVFVLNGAFMSGVIDDKSDDDVDFQQAGVFTGVLSSIILYACLICSYVFGFEFHQFLLAIAGMEMVWIIFCAWNCLRKLSNKK